MRGTLIRRPGPGLWALGVLLLGLVAARGSASDRDGLVAVLPLDVSRAGLDDAARLSVEEAIRTYAGNALGSIGYTVLTGETTLQLLADNDVDPTKACDATCALATARELKARLFLSGVVARTEGDYVAFVRLFEVKSGRQLAAVQIEGSTVKELRKGFASQAAMLFAPLTGVTPVEPGGVTPPVDTKPAVQSGVVTAAVAELVITTDPPSGVRLDLTEPDGKTLSVRAPYRNTRATPGVWQVHALANGLEDQEQSVQVAPDETTHARIELKKLGALKVVGKPVGAAVSVTGVREFQSNGGLPWSATGLHLGRYQIAVSRTGYITTTREVMVEAGQTATVEVTLDKEGTVETLVCTDGSRFDGTLSTAISRYLAHDENACEEEAGVDNTCFRGYLWGYGFQGEGEMQQFVKLLRSLVGRFLPQAARAGRHALTGAFVDYAKRCGREKELKVAVDSLRAALKMIADPANQATLAQCRRVCDTRDDQHWGLGSFNGGTEEERSSDRCYVGCDDNYHALPTTVRFLHRRMAEGISFDELNELASFATSQLEEGSAAAK